MDYQKLINDLKRYGLGNGSALGRHMGIMDEAANAIETLLAELHEAMSERDVLFEEVRGYCHTCKKRNTDFDCEKKCYGHQRGSAWKWRGLEGK